MLMSFLRKDGEGTDGISCWWS